MIPAKGVGTFLRTILDKMGNMCYTAGTIDYTKG